MKPYLKAILFLLLAWGLDILLRNGLLMHFIPLPIPKEYAVFLSYALFTLSLWLVTRRFIRRDGQELKDLGISMSRSNRKDFYLGLLFGVFLWGMVSIVQSYTAGFSWEWRPEISIPSLLHGLVFIFIADLGTELFYRGYPITRFKESFGQNAAILIMTTFVALKSFSLEISGGLLVFSILIPALHTIFFSLLYFKTKRLGAAVGLHTGANFVTISIFDLRTAEPGQAIPSGLFQADRAIEDLSLIELQLPWVGMAIALSLLFYFWKGSKSV